MSDSDRLTRMEVTLEGMSKQLDSMVVLLDRMVRVEEHVSEHQRGVQRIWNSIEEIKIGQKELREELDSWKTVRKSITWIIGISGTIIAFFALLLKMKT